MEFLRLFDRQGSCCWQFTAICETKWSQTEWLNSSFRPAMFSAHNFVLQIAHSILKITDFHFANYRFPFRKLQISNFAGHRLIDLRSANYRFWVHLLNLLVHFEFICLITSSSHTTDFHFAPYIFPFRKTTVLQISMFSFSKLKIFTSFH